MSEQKSSTELAIERTDMASDRTEMATNRTEMATSRTEMASSRTRWAADRTLWAAERTFIAWLRTSISMIGFGISIGKAGDVIEQQGLIEESFFDLRMMGVIFIALAVIGLTGALIQQYRIVNRIAREGYPRVEPVPLGITMGVLVLAFGGLGAVFIFV